MENQSKNQSPGEFEELARRITDAATCEDFRDALDDMNVYLAARHEISTKLETLANLGAKSDARRPSWRSKFGAIHRPLISRD